MGIAGTLLDGRYRVLDVLGDGGMARVYRAEDIRLKRLVAIKTPHEQYLGQPDFRRRFDQEAQLSGSLAHPHIVSIYDVGCDGDLPFLVMEYVDGGSLTQLLAEHDAPLPLPRVLGIMDQLGQALDAAHARGVIHRDIKPENILLTSGNQVKVGDFGIARALGGTGHTTSGVVVGSASYLAPEQAQDRPVTPQSDLYSTGVVLYELLTGRPPFKAETAVATALQHVTRPPLPPSTLVPTVSPALDAVVLKALAKDPRDRFTSGAALTTALRDAMEAWRFDARSPALRPGVATPFGMAQRGSRERPTPVGRPGNRRPPVRRTLFRWPHSQPIAVSLTVALLLGAAGTLALRGAPSAMGGVHTTPASTATRKLARSVGGLVTRPRSNQVPRRAAHGAGPTRQARTVMAGFVPLSVAPSFPELILHQHWSSALRGHRATLSLARATRRPVARRYHAVPRHHHAVTHRRSTAQPSPGSAISMTIAHGVGYNFTPLAPSRRFVLGRGSAYVIVRWTAPPSGQKILLSWVMPGGAVAMYGGCAPWWHTCYTQIPLLTGGRYKVTVGVAGTAVARQDFVVSSS